jgi:hypothetical protein
MGALGKRVARLQMRSLRVHVRASAKEGERYCLNGIESSFAARAVLSRECLSALC